MFNTNSKYAIRVTIYRELNKARIRRKNIKEKDDKYNK
jgi:hypothetical protein